MDLPTLWFWIVAVFFIGYFVLDGFDFGVGMSLPFLGRDDTDRRVLINTIGPVWDLNETWVIVAGAALFAAFPEWYATLFSGFYLPLLAILLALILRGVSFEYRHQRPEAAWKKRFDTMIVVGSAVPAFLWGVAFANIVQGVPLDADHNYIGTVLDLLNPYALLGGATTLLLFFTHGVVFVSLKTDGEIRERARRLASRAGLVTIAVAAVFLAWTNLAQGSSASWLLATAAAATLILVAGERAREGGAGLRPPRGHDRARGPDPVHDALPGRHAGLERHRQQPHHRERLEHALYADRHELDRAGVRAAHRRLSGLDLLDLPQAHHPHSHPGRRPLT